MRKENTNVPRPKGTYTLGRGTRKVVFFGARCSADIIGKY